MKEMPVGKENTVYAVLGNIASTIDTIRYKQNRICGSVERIGPYRFVDQLDLNEIEKSKPSENDNTVLFHLNKIHEYLLTISARNEEIMNILRLNLGNVDELTENSVGEDKDE